MKLIQQNKGKLALGIGSLLAFCGYKAYNLQTDVTLNLSSLHKSYFNNRLIWITGASSGIGEALSYVLASYGSKLILSARTTKKLNKIKQSLISEFNRTDKDIMVLPMDLSKTQTHKLIYESFYNQILTYFKAKSIDILINNAGLAHDTLTDELAYETIHDVYNINLVSPAILTRTVLPDMYKNNFGHIINISSVTSYFQNGAMSIYASSKNGLNSLSRVLQTEMSFLNKNVNCTLCILGAIATGIDKRTKNADGSYGSEEWEKWGIIDRGISPKECAELICTASCNKLKEAWISKQPELTYLYVAQQFPNLHSRFAKVGMYIGFPPFIAQIRKRLSKL
eukprot:116585_1